MRRWSRTTRSTLVAAALLVVGTGACEPEHPKIQCVGDYICNRFPGGQCLLYAPTGNHWCSYADLTCPSGRRWSDLDVGDDLEGVCMEVSVADAGSDGPGAADARSVDAAQADGALDGSSPLEPPVTNNQVANLVLGQPNFTSSAQNVDGQSAISASAPSDVAFAGSSFYFADSGVNARVLGYNLEPSSVRQAADTVVGQLDFTSTVPGPTQSLLGAGSSIKICSDGQRLVVADYQSDRVLLWNELPVANGAPADIVLGQTSFTAAVSGDSASQMSRPAGCWTDGTRLLVADSSNHRVLIWTAFPTTNGEAADLELGWDAFGIGQNDPVITPPTAASMWVPYDVLFDGERLYVVDLNNNRIMVWNGMPTENGQPADYVVGQVDSNSRAVNAGFGGVNAVGLNAPRSIAVGYGSLFVVDGGNRRIVVYTPIPTASGEDADAVLGAINLSSIGSAFATQNTVRPDGLAIQGTSLWVADRDNHRVLRFGLTP